MTKHIKMLRNTNASGTTLCAGGVYAVPDQVSEGDARTLLQLGKAVPVPLERAEEGGSGEGEGSEGPLTRTKTTRRGEG